MQIITDLGSATAVSYAALLGVAGLSKQRKESLLVLVDGAAAAFVPNARALRRLWRLAGIVEASVAFAILGSRWPIESALAAAVTLLSAGAFAAAARIRAPGKPCGCFGHASELITWWTVARALALAVAAVLIAAASAPWYRAATKPAFWLLLLLEFAILLAIFPGVRKAFTSSAVNKIEDCLTASVPLEESVAALKASVIWTDWAHHVRAPDAYADYWRDGCWRFFTFPSSRNEPATAVFGVRLPPGPADYRAALVDDLTGEVLLQASL